MPDPVRFADVAIVGGGAAGLATAIFTARANPKLLVAVLDGAGKLGAKILVSGGGRCNVTNASVLPEDFRGGNRHHIRRILNSFTVPQTVSFFAELGVALHEEPLGKLFPDTNSARTVLAALIEEASRRHVALLTGHRVTAIRCTGGAFELGVQGGMVAARNVVLATGGMSLPKTGSDGLGYELARTLGHSIIAPVPALAPILLDGEFHKQLAGVSHDASLTVRIIGEKPLILTGAMLWTHFGISGPVALDASGLYERARAEGRTVTITACLLPGEGFESTERMLLDLAAAHPREQIRNALAGRLPARLAAAIPDQVGVSGATMLAQLSREQRRRIVHALTQWELPVRGTRGFNFAEVTSGGVPLDEVDTATLQSRITPGLFLVGEILSVDGRIGGFNFQWAWSTAWVAATGLTR